MFNLESAIAEAKARKEEQRKQAEIESQLERDAIIAKETPALIASLTEYLSQDLVEGLDLKFVYSEAKLRTEAEFSADKLTFTLIEDYSTLFNLDCWYLYCEAPNGWSDNKFLLPLNDDSLLIAIDSAINQYNTHLEKLKEAEAKNAETTPPSPPVSCGSRPASAVTFRQQLAADCLVEIMGNPEYPKFTDDYAAELAIEAADALIKKLDQA